MLARTGHPKHTIRTEITDRFDESCQRPVPEAIIAFLDATSHVDAIGSDMLACITGGIAGAFHGELPAAIRAAAQAILPTSRALFHERQLDHPLFPPGDDPAQVHAGAERPAGVVGPAPDHAVLSR